MVHPVIIVHGGAWFIPDCERAAYIGGCQEAAATGWARLRAGASALDAVEAAVRMLEDDPTYDAGRGSLLNREGRVQMDAIIMDGRTLDFGAVAAVERIRNPISLARAVMEQCEHSFVVGPGAEAFAQMLGIPLCDPTDMLGKRDPGHWAPPPHRALPLSSVSQSPQVLPGDTVGAVALDATGTFAVATSTGGTPDKWPGRVGDSPLVGCGAYADNSVGAAAATGSGEALMRIVTSKTVCDLMAAGLPAQAAADAAIGYLWKRVRGYGGVIVLDRAGRVGLAHNTPNLSYAYVTEESGMVAAAEVGAEVTTSAAVRARRNTEV